MYELNNIASSFCCDIDRRDFLKLYRKHTDKQYSFFTIDTTLHSNNYLKYRKTIIKYMSIMTKKDQMQIFNNKIKQINSDYDFEKTSAVISALSSKDIDKYELLTGDHLGIRPSVIDNAKFDYSPLGKVFNKGLTDNEKNEGILKI